MGSGAFYSRRLLLRLLEPGYGFVRLPELHQVEAYIVVRAGKLGIDIYRAATFVYGVHGPM